MPAPIKTKRLPCGAFFCFKLYVGNRGGIVKVGGDGAKKMIHVDNVEDSDFLCQLTKAIYEELPTPRKKMIRPLKITDLDMVMQIWLDGNLQAHHFIASEYWQQNYDFVKQMLPQSKVYVYEDEKSNQIKGFIGLQDEFIAGVFVQRDARAQGIGKQLLNYAKSLNHSLRLSVYQKNELAYKFYKQNEFEVIREQLDDVTNEKEFLMQWQKK